MKIKKVRKPKKTETIEENILKVRKRLLRVHIFILIATLYNISPQIFKYYKEITSESYKTLKVYNEYLKNKESSIGEFTEKSLIQIYEIPKTGLCAIKLKNGQNKQVSFGNYDVYESEEEKEIKLISSIASMDKNQIYDLFTEEKLCNGEEKYTIEYEKIASLGEFILVNNISPIGFTISSEGWTDKDIERIRDYYEEYNAAEECIDDIVDCLKENGFPIPTYDVKDFYKAYVQNRENNESRKLTQK